MLRFALVLAFLLICLGSAFASITNYTVASEVPLNQDLTIYGLHDTAEVLCAFFIFDIADENKVVIRLTDQYTFTDGSFYSEYTITEPEFRRGFDYNAVTKCGSDTVSQSFYVGQRKDFILGYGSEQATADLSFWTDPENSYVAFIFFFIIMAVVAVLLMWGSNFV
jgi:hypothetical protein